MVSSIGFILMSIRKSMFFSLCARNGWANKTKYAWVAKWSVFFLVPLLHPLTPGILSPVALIKTDLWYAFSAFSAWLNSGYQSVPISTAVMCRNKIPGLDGGRRGEQRFFLPWTYATRHSQIDDVVFVPQKLRWYVPQKLRYDIYEDAQKPPIFCR